MVLAVGVMRLIAMPTSDDALLIGPAGQVGVCARQQLGGQHAKHGCQSKAVVMVFATASCFGNSSLCDDIADSRTQGTHSVSGVPSGLFQSDWQRAVILRHEPVPPSVGAPGAASTGPSGTDVPVPSRYL
jgi:hypothetical protein